jgi:hypothetical protein
MNVGILLAAAICYHQPCGPSYTQEPRSFQYYDDKAQLRGSLPEDTQTRARREWQERWPQMHHCRLPACSTR